MSFAALRAQTWRRRGPWRSRVDAYEEPQRMLFTPADLGLLAWYDAELGQPKNVGYVQLDGTSGDYITTPDTPNVSIAGDLEVVMRVKVVDWSAAANQTLAGKYVTTGNQRSWRIYAGTTGNIAITASADGTAVTSVAVAVSPALPDNTWIWVRFRLDLSNGTNSVATVETAADAGSNVEPSSWTLVGTNTGAILAGIFDSTAPLEIGTFGNGTLERLSGAVGRCIVRDGFDGRTLADFNADDCYGPGYLNEGALPTSGGAAYVPLRGVSGDYVWTADKAALRVTGDIEIVARITPDTWLESGDKAICGKWLSATNQRGFAFHLSTGGVLKLYWSTAGTVTVGGTSTAPVSFAVGQTGWVKATLDVDNGAGGHDVKFFTAPDQATEPGSWTQLGATVPSPAGAGTTSIFGCSEPLLVGQAQTNLGPNLAGRYHRVIVRSGIGGSVVADFNAANATVFGLPSDGYGNGWLIADPKHYGNWTLGLPKIYDRSGNGVAPATFGAGSNQPTWLPWKGNAGVYNAGSGSNVQTPDAAALDLTTEADVAAWWSLDDWTPSSTMDLASKWATSNFAYLLRLGTDGKLSFLISGDGAVSQTATATVAVPAVDRQMVGVRATWRASDQRTQFFVTFDSPQAQSPTWVLLSEVTMPGAVASLFAGTAALGMALTAGTPTVGSLHRLQVRSSIGGTLVADFVAASCGQSGYTGSLGNVWTVTRALEGRKAVVQSPVAASARSVILCGTDDLATVLAAAIPPMLATSDFEVDMVARQWPTSLVNGRWFDCRAASPFPGLVMSITSGTTFSATLTDGTNSASPAAATIAYGQRVIASAFVADTGQTFGLAINGATPTTASAAAVGARTGADGVIARTAPTASGYQDIEVEALVLSSNDRTDNERGQLVAYYRGGL